MFTFVISGNKSTQEKSKSRLKSQSKIQDQKSKAQPETEPEVAEVDSTKGNTPTI